MRFHSTTVATLACAVLANCQSPPGFSPSANTSLTVRFGNITVTPNETLAESVVQAAPYLSLNGSHTGTYFIVLADLSFPDASAPTTYPLIQGLQSNRTTRLHWLQNNVTVSSNGTLTWPSTTAAIAPYGPPSPPSNDTAHTYAFWLFPELSGTFRLPGIDGANGRNYTDIQTSARVDFNISSLAVVDGQPIAANYFVVNGGPSNSTVVVNGTTTVPAGVPVTTTASPSGSSTSTGASTSGSASHVSTTGTPTGASAHPSSTSTTSSPGAAATNFAAAGLFGLVGAVALL